MLNVDRKDKWLYPASPCKAPDFTLLDITSHELLSLSDIQTHKVLVSYLPGVWAPWCRKFIKLLNLTQQYLQTLPVSVNLVVIVSQQETQLYEYYLEEELKLTILSDPTGAIGRRFGVFDENVTEPMKISKPSVFILDTNRYIRHIYLGDYLSDRPSIEELVQKTLKAIPPIHSDEDDQFQKIGFIKKLFTH